jgi:hypothetical protein
VFSSYFLLGADYFSFVVLVGHCSRCTVIECPVSVVQTVPGPSPAKLAVENKITSDVIISFMLLSPIFISSIEFLFIVAMF